MMNTPRGFPDVIARRTELDAYRIEVVDLNAQAAAIRARELEAAAEQWETEGGRAMPLPPPRATTYEPPPIRRRVPSYPTGLDAIK